MLHKLLADRVIFITGVGRSGTTILGKLLGSMQPSIYLFEPVIMKYWPGENGARILFEDYILPAFQGRYVNFNPDDDSYVGNYSNIQTIKNAWRLRSRTSALDAMKRIRPYVIIKANEAQGYLFKIAAQFVGSAILHIIRNGNDVVSSAVNRGWYSDSYLQNTVEPMVDGVPAFINDEEAMRSGNMDQPWTFDDIFGDAGRWQSWDQITRCACVWRTLTDRLCGRVIHYEDMIKRPWYYVAQFAQQFKMVHTEITERHVTSILDHKSKDYPDISGRIQEPEKHKFIELQHKLGYA